MSPFRRVEDRRAGPSALGILVPPGPRTVVILRPRALAWDLLPVREGEPLAWPVVFCGFGRDEAAGVARQVQRALAAGAGAGVNPLELVASPAGPGYLVCCRPGQYRWLACPRRPGKPYEPAVFATPEEAAAAADALACILAPQADARQEFYFNTQHFGSIP
jgi:hypothetical protein